MSPRSGKGFRTSQAAADLTVTHRHAAGIDVHSREHFVAVAAEDVPAGFVNADGKLPAGVRKFGANTGDLEALAAWLKDCGVTTVAMEAARDGRIDVRHRRLRRAERADVSELHEPRDLETADGFQYHRQVQRRGQHVRP